MLFLLNRYITIFIYKGLKYMVEILIEKSSLMSALRILG
jgi:hypothetical protein